MDKRTPVLVMVSAMLLLGGLACGRSAPATSPPEPTSAKMATAPATLPAGTSCLSPAPPGQAVVADDMEIMVNAIVRPANDAVLVGARSNATPQPGSEFTFVSLSVTCRTSSGENCVLSPSENFALQSTTGTVYEPRTDIDGVPGMLDSAPFATGSTKYGGIIFEVGQHETHLRLMYTDLCATLKACLALPARTSPPALGPGTQMPPTPSPTSTATATPLPTTTPVPAASPTPSLPTPTLEPTEGATPGSPLPTLDPSATPGSPLPTPNGSSPLATPELLSDGAPPGGQASIPPSDTLLPVSGRAMYWTFMLLALGVAVMLSPWAIYLTKGIPQPSSHCSSAGR